MDVLQSLREVWESERRRKVVSFRNPMEVWEDNPTFLLCEIVGVFWALLTLRHALRHGGRYVQLWFTSILHGLAVESLSYILPDIDNFWHYRGTIMFFNQRLPLYVIGFYPCLHYTTSVVAMRLKLSLWAEPFMVALADLILDLPFDIMGIKLLWWSWHDSDPNIFDRTYSVPWTSYMFHLTFASSFSFLLNGSRYLLTGSADREKLSDNYFSELVCSIITGCLSMPMAAIFQFVPFYHIFHDFYGVHTEVCVGVMVAVYAIIAWSGDRVNEPDARPPQGTRSRRRGYFDEIVLGIVMHFLFYIALVLLANPESYRSTGRHQEIGDCNHVTYLNTIMGQTLPKKTYLCPTNFDEPYFDFSCLNGSLPEDGSNIYTICGTPYSNAMEHTMMVVASSLCGLAFYYQLLYRSGPPSARTQKMKKA